MANASVLMDLPLHGGGQGFDSPRLHFELYVVYVPQHTPMGSVLLNSPRLQGWKVVWAPV
jgi:hypothetical protein